MPDQNLHSPIVVFGGTGHYGRHIVENLLKKGLPVRVLSRSAARARSILLDERLEIVEGDITQDASIVKVLENARAVIISVTAFSPSQIRRLEEVDRDAVLAVLDEARKAGIQRVVYISVYDIREDALEDLHLHMPIAHIKLQVEQALAKSNINWTILGAPPSMEIYFAMQCGNSMLVPGGGPPALPSISPVDVGEIAAQAVLREDLKAQRFRMAGPEALSFPEAAARISRATGTDIRYRKIPLFVLHIAAALSRPFNPFLWHLVESIQLMNGFPQDLVQAVPEDHERLLSTFDYMPLTLEAEAKRRM